MNRSADVYGREVIVGGAILSAPHGQIAVTLRGGEDTTPYMDIFHLTAISVGGGTALLRTARRDKSRKPTGGVS